MITDADIIAAAHAVASVEHVEADPLAVLEDAFLLSMAFTKSGEYAEAVVNTVRALKQLRDGAVSHSALKYDYQGWLSYHFQHKVEQGARADMRIVFRKNKNCIRLLAFGHRNLPLDFYEHISGR